MEMNLVVLLVCAAAVVVAGISDDSKVNTIHHHLSKRELHMLFGASHHSEVPAYKLVVPTDLHGGIVKRHADVIDDQLHYKFEGLHDDDEPFELLLHRKMEPLSPTFVMVERHEDISQNRMRHVESPSCYYFANVTSHANSIAAVSTCDGLRGVIMTPRSHYMIQPVPSSLIRRHRRSTDGAAADAILETSHFLYEP
ncbi:PREDICTED: A disintegrin and metalloproteinase with thrombospondin motifs 18-like, partial [Priapulus caudatus]|uniref:A disintegrin and metalloproteinase with thrombospondin motifs 18-like n=1 Tax=Priapulus caudatus TaxID=37621 RepID=A0ABM1EJ52_PRICU